MKKYNDLDFTQLAEKVISSSEFRKLSDSRLDNSLLDITVPNPHNPNLVKLSINKSPFAALKIYPNNYQGWNFDSISYARNSVRVLQLIEQYHSGVGFKYSKLLSYSFSTNPKWICTEWIVGDPLLVHHDKTSQILLNLTTMLMQMYSNTTNTTYDPGIPKLLPPQHRSSYWHLESHYHLADIERADKSTLEPSNKERLIKYIWDWKSRLDNITTFCLCHNDLVPENIIYDATSNKIGIVDWAKGGYSSPMRDIANICWIAYLYSVSNWEQIIIQIIESAKKIELKAEEILPFFLGSRLLSYGMFHNNSYIGHAKSIFRLNSTSNWINMLKQGTIKPLSP